MRLRQYSTSVLDIWLLTYSPRAVLCIWESGTPDGQALSQRMQFEHDITESSIS